MIMNNKKILIVDDDIDIITTLKAILEKENFQVFTASNKTEAKDVAEKNSPDMAILDVMMSTHYEGFELAKDFKNSELFKDMPVCMLTSIDVLVTTRESVREMAREYRQTPEYNELKVILVKNENTGKAGIDYLAEDGRSIWLPVDGFIAKPVIADKIISEVKKHLQV